MKIAFLTTDNREHDRTYSQSIPRFGMAPEALLDGFSSLSEIQVHVISCTQRPMQSPKKLADNIWYHSLQVPKLGWMRTAYQGCIRAIRKKLKKIRPDIVHGQGTERDCAISAVLSGFANVLTIHGNMAELARLFHSQLGSYGCVAARLENFALRRTSGVLCNSSYTERLVLPRAKRTWRIPNALRREFFNTVSNAPIDSHHCILLCVGAIIERKRQLELLDVVENLSRRGFKFEFDFIGRANSSDRYAAAFLERLKKLGASANTHYLGEVDALELIQRFDAASGLVHFPSEEAFGLVVAEALARDLKFFGARVGGITDIAEGVPGAELFDQNDWCGLTAALSLWISQGHPRASGAAGLMRQRYHPEVVARRHIQIYEQVLS
jgi:glycosyltransferase involved in cell wall biosynthesis